MIRINVIVGAYAFVFLAVCILLLLGEAFGASFRASYGDALVEILKGVVTAFVGFLTAFAAERAP